ncbi:hypothetical protein PHYPSEUDO_006155 [Phytophthora pseudosyringae]|uniref:Tify domain-containing protein n=1 Tax=Phytophthora pseudosyringae TaxID=221518 RepID=A0A8T1WFT4_9STRA|nr:hypothetical protein PHYPSEUDO_006155 [Phytophthora pseudosyringae]
MGDGESPKAPFPYICEVARAFMMPAESSQAEAPAPTTPNPTSTQPSQDAGASPGQVVRPEAVQETQATAPNEPQDSTASEQTVAVADGGSSQPKMRASHPRAAAAAANAVMAEQAKEEEAPAAEVPPTSRRPSRAAAAAANAGLARQAQEEQGTLGMLISSALGTPFGDVETKKRTTEGAAAPAAKRPKVTAASSRKVAQNMLENESAEQPPRGKKRRQAPVYEAAPMIEASPIITDLPPLPFTSPSPDLGLKDKKAKKKQMTKAKKSNHGTKEVEGYCEFCKKVANICVLMHCHSCRRVYHAGCFLHAFKPYVAVNTPILDQMERLQLDVPERRGNIFRCASCKAAFLDFYESGGYLWDCDCPTCSQPEKAIYYRQRKLVEMMNDMELEKQRKKEKKGQKKSGAANTSGNMPVSTPSRSNSASRSRRTRGSTVMSMDVVDDGGPQTAPGGTSKPEDDQNMKLKEEISDGQAEAHKVNEVLEQQAKDEEPEVKQQVTLSAEPSNEPSVPQKQEEQAPKIKYEPVGEPEHLELTGDKLVSAVRVLRDEKNGGWCFPVMCSRTASLRVSGIMKTGNCKWFPKKIGLIQCDCCSKMFKYSEFVHHTDSSLVKDAKCAQEDPMPFLFVEHRDNTQHTPLEQFQPALRRWAGRESANNTPTKSRKGLAMKQDAFAAVVAPANPEAEAETVVSRLRALALFKRPKHRSDNTSTAACLSDPVSLDFVAQIVCLSPKYVMNMANGGLADRVLRSKTSEPGDSFPRKAGWFAFSRKAAKARQITCVCCEVSFTFDAFVDHAGISLSELKKKPRQLLYVVERQDESALMPYSTFALDLDAAATSNVLEMLLGDLRPPPPSLRPLK